MVNLVNINQTVVGKSINFGSKNVKEDKQELKSTNYTTNIYPEKTVSIYDKKASPALTHTSWFYINDVHGKMANMERIYSAVKDFDNIEAKKFSPNFWDETEKNISKFKVSSGDIILGANYTNNQVANKFLNWTGFIATALGNHELDVEDPTNLAKLFDDSKCKTLAINIIVDENSPLKDKIEKSMVVERDGEKYGLIGIAPSDMKDRVKHDSASRDIEVYDFDKTIELVKKEVENLKSQNINKIIVLSHSGNHNEKRLAQETEGIDIIFGAHTHELIKGIKEGENLLYSKSGEPVVITQAGKDGETVGVLNVDFDENGVIKKVQNNLIKTTTYDRALPVKYAIESIIGKPEVVGRVLSAVSAPENRLIEPNPHAYVITDAMKNELGTEIAILNAGNIRGSFMQGPVDTRIISDITPFEDSMLICNLTEKQIVDAIKFGCKSITKTSNKPGLIFPSGLRYECNKRGDLLSLEFIDKDNKAHKIDVENPSSTKTYSVAIDDFFATGGDGYLEKNKNPEYIVKKFSMDKNKLACDYIKKMTTPLTIEDDGRVKIFD